VPAEGLAGVIEPHTRGNPYETVEVLNALRRDGLLAATCAPGRNPAVTDRLAVSRS